MTSPNGENRRYVFNLSQQRVQPQQISLNNATFVTVPANISNAGTRRPIIIQTTSQAPQRQSPYQVVLPGQSVRPMPRMPHFKLNAAGEYIIDGSATSAPRRARPLTRRPLKSSESKTLCSNCGIESLNEQECDSCKRPIGRVTTCSHESLQQAVEDGIRATREEIERKSRRGISASSFYNGGESDFSRYVKSSSAASSPKRTSSRLQRKRLIYVKNAAESSDNVCITISSDSEEDEQDSKLVARSTSESKIEIEVESDPEEGTPKKKPRQDDCVDASPVEKAHPAPLQVDSSTNSESDCVNHEEELTKATLNLKIDSIRIGQLRLTPSSVLRLSHSTLTMTAKCTHTGDDCILTISWGLVTTCELCCDEKGPCMYITLRQGCLPQLRQQLEMEKGKFPYYDPTGAEDEKLFIFHINQSFLTSTTQCSVGNLIEKITLIRKKLKKPSTFFHLIKLSESERRQMLATAAMEQRLGKTEADTNDELSISSDQTSLDERPESDSLVKDRGVITRNQTKETQDDLKFMFSGPRKELFVYPPPPMKGGISVTNEDQFCLNEGEFLNDVIIEFYLKYVYNKILSEEDQKRSHIFSCFFYERLMQKSKRLKGETLAERRHNQVKKWTRNVDIFSKDFIFVPINEASHWYLVVICFPWMVDRLPTTGKQKADAGHKTPDSQQSDCEDLPAKSKAQDNSQGSEDAKMSDDCKSTDNSISQSQSDSKTPSNSEEHNHILNLDTMSSNSSKLDTSEVTKEVQNCDKLEENSNQNSEASTSSEQRKLISVNLPNFALHRRKAKSKDIDAVKTKSASDNKDEMTEMRSPILQSGAEADSKESVISKTDKKCEHSLGAIQSPDKEVKITSIETEALLTKPNSKIASVETEPLLSESNSKIASAETRLMVSESNSENTLEPEVEPTHQSENTDSNGTQVSSPLVHHQEVTSASAKDLSSSPKHNNLLNLFVSPGCPDFTLPKELERKCLVSPERKPEIRISKLSNQSPVRIKYPRLCGTSDSSNKNMPSSVSSEDSLVAPSSPNHSTTNVCQNFDKPHDNMGQEQNFTKSASPTHSNNDISVVCNSGAQHCDATAVSDINTPTLSQSAASTLLNPRFETSTHELSDSDDITPVLGQEQNSEPTLNKSQPMSSTEEELFVAVKIDSSPSSNSVETKEGNSAVSETTSQNSMESCILLENSGEQISISSDRDASGENPITKTEQCNPHSDIPLCNNCETGNNPNILNESPKSDTELTDEPMHVEKNSSLIEDGCPRGVEQSVSVESSPRSVSCVETDETLTNTGNFTPKIDESCTIDSSATSIEETISSADSDDATRSEEDSTTDDDKNVHKHACILIFDSLRGPSRYRTCTTLREYLTMEWKTRKQSTEGEKTFDKDTMKMCSVSVPQQDNYTDCGLFLLHYVEKFFSDPITQFFAPIKLENWFSPDECGEKRKDIKNVTDKLHEEWVSKGLNT